MRNCNAIGFGPMQCGRNQRAGCPNHLELAERGCPSRSTFDNYHNPGIGCAHLAILAAAGGTPALRSIWATRPGHSHGSGGHPWLPYRPASSRMAPCKRGHGVVSVFWPGRQGCRRIRQAGCCRYRSVAMSRWLGVAILTSGKIPPPFCTSPRSTLRANKPSLGRWFRRFPSHKPVRSACRDTARARDTDSRFPA
jgi:hypothetical protein